MRAMEVLAVLSAAVLTHTAARAQDAAQVFSHAEVQQQIEKLLPASLKNGSSGSTLGDYGMHALKLSVRSTSGGAEIHAHFDDVMVVLDGSATLIAGGTVIGARTDTHGETKGKEIVNGVKRTIRKGDILHIPAGTPHQLILPKGGQFSAFVVKVREP